LEAALATAGAVAHELNQPLASLLISADMLAMAQETSDIKRLARIISEQCQRVGKTTQQLARLVRYQTKVYLGNQCILDLENSSRDDGPEDEKKPESKD
jgi:C4-dicarboxylate-specific signal transduction histidine kinase